MKSVISAIALAGAIGAAWATPISSQATVLPATAVVQGPEAPPASDAQRRPARFAPAVAYTGLRSRPGWFRTSDKQGYGWRNGATETTFGLYSLPAKPDLPGPRIAPEGKGAAGFSFSVNLGD